MVLAIAPRRTPVTHRFARPTDLGAFDRDILPALADVPPAELARATGLSVAYCRQVKGGQAKPHPMWWQAMREIAREG